VHRHLRATRGPAAAMTAAATVAGALLATAAPAPAADGPTARVWVTTPDGAQRMAQQEPVTFAPGGSDDLTVTVDPSRTYQRMRGFGASLTDSSAHLLAGLPKSRRDSTMADLFGPSGNRLGVLRQPMGASDFVAGDFYTYDDVPPGETDYDLSEFSVSHDRAEILPLLRQALRLNPDVTVVATPWSPPAWMKTNGDLVGGRLIDDPRIYATYARYFVKFVQAYADARVPVHAVTLQNEPQNRNPRSYPGMDLPAWQERKLAVAVDEAFATAGVDTAILGYDHNWSTHPDDVASTPPGEDPETDYPYRLLGSPEADAFDGIAYHCYAGDPSDQTELHEAYPGTELWFTECSGSHGASDPPAQYFADTLKWHARNLVMGVTRNWSSTVVNWNLALDPTGGPHNGGCDTCTGVVTVGAKNTVTRNAEYYTLGHLAGSSTPVRFASRARPTARPAGTAR
jgi:glucosylceramidase